MNTPDKFRLSRTPMAAGFLFDGPRESGNHPPFVRASGSDPSWAATTEGDKFLVLSILNAYEDLGVSLNEPDFVFEVMALKEKLGLPVTRGAGP